MTYQDARYCAACKRDYFQHFMQGTQTDGHTLPHHFARRAMAKIVDVNLVVLVQFAFATTFSLLPSKPGAAWPESTASVLALATFVVGSTAMIAHYGGTPGKLMFQERVVYRDGSTVRLGGALTRTVAEFASMACLGLGYFITDSDGKFRTLHDRISGTQVVVRSGDWPWT